MSVLLSSRSPRMNGGSPALRVPSIEGPAQIFPEAVDVLKARRGQGRQVLVEAGGKRPGGPLDWGSPTTAHHRLDVARGGPPAFAARIGRTDVALLEACR